MEKAILYYNTGHQCNDVKFTDLLSEELGSVDNLSKTEGTDFDSLQWSFVYPNFMYIRRTSYF